MFFPIWDRTIADRYGCYLGTRGTNGRVYLNFMGMAADQCRRLRGDSTCPADVVKALDEWNYVRYTRALAPA